MILTVVTGPMFAGKTTYLLEYLRVAKRDKIGKTIFFSPSKDTRSGINKVLTHDGASVSCISVERSEDILLNLGNPFPAAIFIDEVQFFDDSLPTVLKSLRQEVDLDVYCAGLSQTSEGIPFYVTSLLLAEADRHVILTARCDICGARARYTQYVGDEAKDADIKVGGSDMYRARCSHHWSPR